MTSPETEERFRNLATLPMEPIGGERNAVWGAFASFVEVLRHREVLGLLVRRDLKARYKDSALGLVWTLIRPLTQLAIYYVVIGKFLGAERGIHDFAIYVFTGLTAYGLFNEIIAGGTASVVGNGGLIKKVYLPREVFPLASVGSALFNFSIQLVVLLAAIFTIGSRSLTLEVFYFIPALLLIVIYGTAFALLLSAANVYLRDIQYIVEVSLLILLWASPIVYSWQSAAGILHGSILLDVYTDNPMTLAVLGFQRAFWANGVSDPAYPALLGLRMAIAIVVGLILLVVFQRVFARLQGNFAQEL